MDHFFILSKKLKLINNINKFKFNIKKTGKKFKPINKNPSEKNINIYLFTSVIEVLNFQFLDI